MDAVKSFNDELSSIYETKPPVSRAKMTILTKKAIKGIKFYKHIVQSMEKFIQKCRPEYKVPGLYVIDSVVRQSRHQFGHEKDVFMPRLCKNIISTFKHLYKCPPEEKQRIVRVLNLWQKNNVFPPEIVQQLLAMGGTTSDGASASSQPNDEAVSAPMEQATSSATAEAQPDAGALTNMLAQLLANPNNPQIQQLTGLLSTSQQAQLQALVSQVKGHQGESKDLKLSEPEVPQDRAAASVFLPKQEDSIPPFLHSEPEMKMEHGHRPNPSFNRAVLDFDYSDDDSPKSQEKPPKPGIDLELLAKLPTVDQLKQLSVASGGLMSNGAEGPKRDADDRRRHLGHEQEIFERQINQMSSEFNDRERSQDDHSSRSTSRRRRSRSRKRSRSRSRERHKHHRRSHSRDRHKRRSRSRDRHRTSHHRHSRSEDKEQEKEREREKRGFPPVKEGCISLCSKTLWIGNLASKVSQQEIKTEVEAYGPIESINMIPPRGCVYICMEKREDASKALHKLRHTRMGGKQLKADWAPGKEVKDEFKEFWVKEHGVNYIPLEKVAGKLAALKNQGFIDVESVPESIKAKLESDEVVVSEAELPQPPVINPAGLMNPQLLQGNVPVMMRPAFPFPGMGQFGGIPQQRLPGFQLPGQRPVITGIDPSPQKAETEAKRTAEDEKLDGAQKAAAVAASIMSAVQPTTLTMAQPRFQGVGQVPVQIRMMPGMPHHQAMMPGQRIGMMPIRMGVPMQFRPGPGFARVPMAQPTMVPFQQQQHMQMQRLGQPMVPPMHQAPLNLPGGPPGPRFPHQRLEGPPAEKVDERDRDEKEPRKAEELGQPPKVDEEPRPFVGRLPPMPGIRMGERPPMMEGRPPMDDRPPRFGFRRSPPPGRYGFDRRGPPMEGRPRFPNRDRFPDRGMDRDDRRRDDMRRPRDRSRSRERDRRDRGMRDRRFDDRDRRGGFGGDWGRDRGRFGGRDDFDSGRGGRFGGGFGDRGGRMEEEISEEDLEYQKKREEVLRQRREKEDEYVVEEVDLSAFGLPSGFGTVKEEEEEQPESEKREERRERDSDRRRDRDRREDRGRDRDRRDRRRDDRSDRDRGRRDRRRSRDRDHRDDRERDRNGDDRAKKEDEQQETKRIKLEDADNMETEPQDGANDNQIKEDPESVKQETEPSQSSEAAIKEEFAKDSAIEEEKQHSDAAVEQEFKREFEDKPQLGVAHDPGFKPEINPDLEFKPEFQEKQQLDAAADPGVEPGLYHAPEFKPEFEDEPQLDSTVQSSVTMHEPMQELEHEPLYNDAKIEPSSPPRHNDLPSEINNDVRNDDMAHESQNNKGLEPLSEEVQCKITNPDVTDVTNTNEKLVEDPPTAIEQT